MTSGESTAERSSRWKLSTGKASLLIVLGTFVCVLLVRQLGWLQFLEFQTYDFFIRHQIKTASSEPIVLVEMTESDIQNPTLDYPIHDSKLAQVLRILEAHHRSTSSRRYRPRYLEGYSGSKKRGRIGGPERNLANKREYLRHFHARWNQAAPDSWLQSRTDCIQR
jgi:hypothetical protein